MTTYTYIDADQNTIGKSDDGITTYFFHPIAGDPLYEEMVAAGITPEPYVEPEVTPLTAEQKLANAGLTVAELKQLLSD